MRRCFGNHQNGSGIDIGSFNQAINCHAGNRTRRCFVGQLKCQPTKSRRTSSGFGILLRDGFDLFIVLQEFRPLASMHDIGRFGNLNILNS